MNIFLIGATGLIGCAAAQELINRGHHVRGVALPPIPDGMNLPYGLAFDFRDYRELTDDELRGWFYECEGFVFAAYDENNNSIVEEIPENKTDEKQNENENFESESEPEPQAQEPVIRDPLERVLWIAKECGVRRAVICGSYYGYFDKKWPFMELSKLHPYIRKLRDREELALSFAGHGFNVAVLEFPLIFGVQQGCKSYWEDIVKTVQKMPVATLYPKGGTTMITKKQAACAIAGAIERSYGGKSWPIGCYNIPWREFFPVVHRGMDMPGRPVITIPNWPINLSLKLKERKRKKRTDSNYDNGIDKIKFFEFTCADTYIDRTYGIIPLGVDDDDITSEIVASIRYTVECLEKQKEINKPADDVVIAEPEPKPVETNEVL